MLRLLKAAWILFWAILLTLILFFPIVIAALLGKRGDAAFHGTQIYAWIILKVCGIRLKVRGRENIEPGQRYVILSNHASYLDPPALVLALGLQYRWVIKKELRKVPLFGLALEASRNLFIDRSKGSDALESIKRGVGQLPDGTGILIFPEGTRSWDGKLLPFKKGGFVIAQDGELPILPVTICGSHQRLPKGSAAFSSGDIEIVIHPPMASGALPLDDLMTDVRNSIASSL
ncbi:MULTISPECIES: lysophospholipid acyltransferase family protein [Marinobacter]|jgi:1-acyl-sn-glycerol-3-phosphate acyltransferase|uniref:1-acyl-sn-glycerol-3-phosphate acyltransferase n=1 Tax=Marinobacter manganoxydans MnI7-9 TaxID=1094979 RepID=G6YT84_9GAMM|nr:lysophospholipid acyltransferase family protein [Marinobacter manganoxydans]EHJ04535.1 1-acylglycerol-3-phosphate O-acyltransferase [Marinobacter manganoxydans MnI7-9]MCR9187926.1 1-acyl-sn-glycerol-3-phosphate acyltransferase [Alteromonadaceae bacterium]PHS46108.1 MAG: 1-acyl-sn-glycerol-3-phosphate acyltransferase [Marinobacter sp.]|tara:strand:- start:2721 stop:3416 length:696 start_codon:yes stop_codon:yes gene_type:complete